MDKNDGRCTRAQSRAKRERQSDLVKAANLRKAQSLPNPKLGPKVAR